MQISTNILVAAVVIFGLASCSNAEQKPEASTQPTTITTATNTDATNASESSESTTAKTETKVATGAAYEGTINGVISDSMCGKDHSKMGEAGKDAACVEKCVTSGAKYVLVDEKGDSYGLSDQKKPKQFAGKKVAITGHIDPTEKAIHVHSLVIQ